MKENLSSPERTEGQGRNRAGQKRVKLPKKGGKALYVWSGRVNKEENRAPMPIRDQHGVAQRELTSYELRAHNTKAMGHLHEGPPGVGDGGGGQKLPPLTIGASGELKRRKRAC